MAQRSGGRLSDRCSRASGRGCPSHPSITRRLRCRHRRRQRSSLSLLLGNQGGGVIAVIARLRQSGAARGACWNTSTRWPTWRACACWQRAAAPLLAPPIRTYHRRRTSWRRRRSRSACSRGAGRGRGRDLRRCRLCRLCRRHRRPPARRQHRRHRRHRSLSRPLRSTRRQSGRLLLRWPPPAP